MESGLWFSPQVALMQANISRKNKQTNKKRGVMIHQLGESMKRDLKKRSTKRGEMKATVHRKNFSIRRGSSVKNRSDSHVSFQESRWGAFGILVRDHHPLPQTPGPHSTCGLTSNISPRRNTIATQETISAWFWMTNSWLSTGGFLVVFFRIPISARFGPTFFFCLASRSADVVAFCRILLLSWSARTLKAPSCFLRAKGQAAIEWRVTLLLVGGVRGERAAAPDQRRALRTGEKQLGLSIATCRSGVSL